MVSLESLYTPTQRNKWKSVQTHKYISDFIELHMKMNEQIIGVVILLVSNVLVFLLFDYDYVCVEYQFDFY